MRARWLWLLVVVGCDDNRADIAAHSGDRLRIAWFDFDGTRYWQPEEGRHFSDGRFINTERYYDRLRDETCAPEPYLDGITRCTPDVELIDTKRYLDAECTTRVTENPDKFKYVGDYDEKCNVRRVWKVFPVTSEIPNSPVYYRAADGKCWPTTSSAPYLGVLGDELPYDSFATIDTEHAPDGARIQVRYRKSDDGVALPINFYDAKLGPADLQYYGQYVAMPPVTTSARAETLFYADAACSKGFVRVDRGCPAPASAAGDFPTFYAIGQRATSPPAFARSFGMCTPLANVPDGDFFEVLTAGPVQPVVITHTTATIDGQRMQLNFASTPDLLVAVRELFDTQLQTTCVPRKFPDDVYRCAPDQTAADLIPGLYAESNCLNPLDVAQLLAGHTPPRLVLQDRALLGAGVKVFELGEPYTEPLYSLGGPNGTECGPTIYDNVVRVGRQVDWSELATATLATD